MIAITTKSSIRVKPRWLVDRMIAPPRKLLALVTLRQQHGSLTRNNKNDCLELERIANRVWPIDVRPERPYLRSAGFTGL